jgi:hypothetical protein
MIRIGWWATAAKGAGKAARHMPSDPDREARLTSSLNTGKTESRCLQS